MTAYSVEYDLESLYEDQDPDFFVHALPQLMVWVRGAYAHPSRQRAPFVFEVDRRGSPGVRLGLTWNDARLYEREPWIRERVRQLSMGRALDREHVTEIAGCVLAMVALSALPPKRRVVHVRAGFPPDLLFDATPGAYRGVEVAARSRGGRAALDRIRAEKLPGLVGRPGVVEVHLSLWCGRPRLALLENVL